ncbi:MAG: SDR family oxidoreductase [Bacteroidales bacterium]|nr:SDR family oxidoreductase [Bacteroidales bacterium]
MKGVFNKVIVTGGAKGIGKEIARAFSETGASVIIADRDESAGKECVDSLSFSGRKVRFFHADVSVPPEVTAMIRESARMMGGIDILVNNAGFGIWKSPLELSTDEWDNVINTNLRGTFLCSREAAKIMKAGGGGSIINIASTRALMSEPDSEAYAASKGGILSLTHALASSLAKFRIRVNCISAGWIETGDYEKLREIDHTQHFSGRVGMPSDIARACIFLAENDFINAANIIIDGGMTRKMIYEP